MSKKTLIWIVVSWVILMLINYYLMNFFFLALELLAVLFLLLIIIIVQLIKLILERKNISKLRILKIFTFTTLFLLTFFRWIPNSIIEKVDWYIFYNKRNEIVELVKKNELNPNVSFNKWVCELPYEFPIVSNGGNDIGISRNNKDITVTFWVFRNFFDSPSTQFIFTNNKSQILEIEKKIKKDPDNNWKIEDNWYRTYGY